MAAALPSAPDSSASRSRSSRRAAPRPKQRTALSRSDRRDCPQRQCSVRVSRPARCFDHGGARAARLVAVDGSGGAGKSTFARGCPRRPADPVIHTDDFAAADNPIDRGPGSSSKSSSRSPEVTPRTISATTGLQRRWLNGTRSNRHQLSSSRACRWVAPSGRHISAIRSGSRPLARSASAGIERDGIAPDDWKSRMAGEDADYERIPPASVPTS